MILLYPYYIRDKIGIKNSLSLSNLFLFIHTSLFQFRDLLPLDSFDI